MSSPSFSLSLIQLLEKSPNLQRAASNSSWESISTLGLDKKWTDLQTLIDRYTAQVLDFKYILLVFNAKGLHLRAFRNIPIIKFELDDGVLAVYHFAKDGRLVDAIQDIVLHKLHFP